MEEARRDTWWAGAVGSISVTEDRAGAGGKDSSGGIAPTPQDKEERQHNRACQKQLQLHPQIKKKQLRDKDSTNVALQGSEPPYYPQTYRICIASPDIITS